MLATTDIAVWLVALAHLCLTHFALSLLMMVKPPLASLSSYVAAQIGVSLLAIHESEDNMCAGYL